MSLRHPVGGVFSGCFALFRARENEGKKMLKQYFQKKKGENRGKTPKTSKTKFLLLPVCSEISGGGVNTSIAAHQKVSQPPKYPQTASFLGRHIAHFWAL